MPGTESQRAIDALQREFPAASGATGTIVVAAPGRLGRSPTPANGRRGEPGDRRPASCPGVVGAVDPFQAGAVSPDGRYALIQVQFADRADAVTDEQRAAYEQSGRRRARRPGCGSSTAAR